MLGDFNILSNLHYILFGVLVAIDFLLFNLGMLFLFLAKDDIFKAERGKKLLFNSFLIFIIIILIASGFYLFKFLFQKEGPYISPEDLAKLPPAYHISVFPPGPEFIKIGSSYFSGPWPLRDKNLIEKPAVFAVLCKQEEKYDIMYISRTEGENLLDNSQYQCWLGNCESDKLYLATYISGDAEIAENLILQTNPICEDHIEI